MANKGNINTDALCLAHITFEDKYQEKLRSVEIEANLQQSAVWQFITKRHCVTKGEYILMYN